MYSLGRIRRAKLAHLGDLRPGDRVLYPGVGRGEDALAAARLGARVTAVDRSSAMLARLRRRLDAEGLSANLEHADLFDHRERDYEFVVANFVLNVFARAQMRTALSHLLERLGPAGRIAIADFAPATGSALSRLGAQVNYWPIDVAAWVLRLAALHPIYDYALELDALWLPVDRRERFGPYEALVTVARS